MQPVEACYHSVADRNGSRALTSPAMHTAFVTGAATGLGYVIACSLARAGYDLAVSSHEAGRLSELLCDPAVQNRKVIPVQLDLRVEADITSTFLLTMLAARWSSLRSMSPGLIGTMSSRSI